ncbi:DUF1772 domain-containing protein [Bradyrhizobium prioriisuperbiae]|uniref:DUF1772 domain-containing protein n=1 Tax=Bradyrhizobium prioriisuperbiae TaxID=2854389 RepID=UPI0028EFDFAD|nr:DUF1772 domain-containing protein [Bradyrhizobium prioritasuperba]
MLMAIIDLANLLLVSLVVDFADLLLAALLVGSIFGVWLSHNPTGLDAATYIAQQQSVVRSMRVTMPRLGALTVLVTLVATLLAYEDRTRVVTLAIAAACFMATGLITRFLSQPINTEMLGWSKDAPPENWTELRNSWWRWHVVRLRLGLVALCLVIAAALERTAA